MRGASHGHPPQSAGQGRATRKTGGKREGRGRVGAEAQGRDRDDGGLRASLAFRRGLTFAEEILESVLRNAV
jgi:hypothetical protein